MLPYEVILIVLFGAIQNKSPLEVARCCERTMVYKEDRATLTPLLEQLKDKEG